MEINQISSIELDRTKPFAHVIKMKDEHGYVLEEVKVLESNGNEVLAKITEAWLKAIGE